MQKVLYKLLAKLHKWVPLRASFVVRNVVEVIDTTTFKVISSWHSHCKSCLGSFDECRTMPGSQRSLDQANRVERLVHMNRLL